MKNHSIVYRTCQQDLYNTVTSVNTIFIKWNHFPVNSTIIIMACRNYLLRRTLHVSVQRPMSRQMNLVKTKPCIDCASFNECIEIQLQPCSLHFHAEKLMISIIATAHRLNYKWKSTYDFQLQALKELLIDLSNVDSIYQSLYW